MLIEVNYKRRNKHMASKKGKKANGEGSIYKQPNGLWRGVISVGFKDDGSILRKTFSGKTKTEVIAKIDDFKTDMKQGLIPKNNNITVAEWFYSWLFIYKKNSLKASSFERYHGIYKNYIENSVIGTKSLKDIKTLHVQEYYNRLKGNGYTISQIKNLNKCLKSSLTLAINDGYILVNPCKAVKLPADNKIRELDEDVNDGNINAFTLEEQKLFIDACNKHKYGFHFIFLLNTGLRLGEFLALLDKDFNFEDRYVSITKTLKDTYIFDDNRNKKYAVLVQPPKTESSRRKVPLNDKLIEKLKEYKVNREGMLIDPKEHTPESPFFCTVLGTYLNNSNVRKVFKKILYEAGLPIKFRIHDLRHTFATRLFENGVSPKTVQKLLGHSKLETTMNIYTHVTNDVQQEAINLIDIF